MSKYTAFPRLLPFDRDADFIFRRSTKILGKVYQDQDVVPKEMFTTRRLRQLYESRMIQITELVKPDGEKTMPNFRSLPTTAVKDFLKTNGVVPRNSWMRATLVERAEKLWEQKHGVTPAESN